MTFDEIKLNRTEFLLLKKLNCENVAVTAQNERELNRLYRLKFAYPVYSQSVDDVPHAAIDTRGEDYLAYMSAVRLQRKWENIRYAITTAIALAAFIKSFFF